MGPGTQIYSLWVSGSSWKTRCYTSGSPTEARGNGGMPQGLEGTWRVNTGEKCNRGGRARVSLQDYVKGSILCKSHGKQGLRRKGAANGRASWKGHCGCKIENMDQSGARGHLGNRKRVQGKRDGSFHETDGHSDGDTQRNESHL